MKWTGLFSSGELVINMAYVRENHGKIPPSGQYHLGDVSDGITPMVYLARSCLEHTLTRLDLENFVNI